MEAAATFAVTAFDPTEYTSPVTTGVPVGFAFMSKTFTGDINGTSRTQFTSAYDGDTDTGTYVAMEAFEGAVLGRSGAFAFAHSGTMNAGTQTGHYLVIVPGSGTAELEGIAGTGSLGVDADGTHRLVLDVTFD